MKSHYVFAWLFLCGAMAFQQLNGVGDNMHNGKAAVLHTNNEESHADKGKHHEQKEEKSQVETKQARSESGETFPVPTTARCIIIIVIQYMILYTAQTFGRTYCEMMGYTAAVESKLLEPLTAAAQTMTYAPMLCTLFIACRMRVEFLSAGTDQPQMWVQNCMYATTYAVTAQAIVVLVVAFVARGSVSVNPKTGDMEAPARSDDESSSSKTFFYTLSAVRYVIMVCMYGGIAGIIVGINVYLPPGTHDVSKLPPPAPAVECTMILTVLFFSAQLIIALCQTYTELTELKGTEGTDSFVGKFAHIMAGVASTVEFGPMVAIVFLAARMRALQHHAQPSTWAQECMYITTYALCLTAFLALVVPLFLGGKEKVNPATGQVSHEVENASLGTVLLAVRCITLICVYGGIAGVIYSIYDFKAPEGPTAPVSPTVQCVVALTAQFFLVYGALMACLTVSEMSGGDIPLETYSFYGAFEAAKATLPWAPMLSILFVTTRMYALLITNKKGSPQKWVQDGMWMATTSVGMSFVACIATALCLDNVTRDADGNPKLGQPGDNKTYLINLLELLRFIMMIFLYFGIFLVVYGLFTLTEETANYGDGKSKSIGDMTKKFIDTFPTF